MGQYYKPIILDENGDIEHWMLCYDFDSGAKLMEHSWLGNRFVAAFESLLAQEAPRRVVWAGDYADAELDERGNSRTIDSDVYSSGEGDANLWTLVAVGKTDPYRPPLPGLGDKMFFTGKRDKNGDSIWKVAKDSTLTPTVESAVRVTQTSHPYILNWDKHEFVSKRKVPRVIYSYAPEYKMAIHPLPLLTVEGNGRGGGDFHLPEKGRFEDRSQATGNFDLIGSWARDHISVSKTKPVDWAFAQEAEKWTEIHFDLVEMGAMSAVA